MRYVPTSVLKALTTVLAATFVSTCGLIGTPFPKYGSTAFRVEGVYAPSTTTSTAPMTIYRDGGQLRVDTTLPKLGHAAIVYESATGAAYALAPVSAYPALATPVIAATPASMPQKPGAAPLPPTTTLAPLQPAATGIAVRIADADAPQPFETYWASLGPDGSKAVGGCYVAGQHGHWWQERTTMKGLQSRAACVTSDGIVLEVRQGDKALFQATRVQRGRMSASLFAIPASYQRLDPQALASSQPAATATGLTALTPAG